MPRDLHCHVHHPRKYSQCGCAFPPPPTKPQTVDTCKWCFGTYGHPSCRRFKHLEMVLAEYEVAVKFYERTYGVKIAAPVEPLAPAEKPVITDAMRDYLSSCGRKGGKSRSAAKVMASSKNIKNFNRRETSTVS